MSVPCQKFDSEQDLITKKGHGSSGGLLAEFKGFNETFKMSSSSDANLWTHLAHRHGKPEFLTKSQLKIWIFDNSSEDCNEVVDENGEDDVEEYEDEAEDDDECDNNDGGWNNDEINTEEIDNATYIMIDLALNLKTVTNEITYNSESIPNMTIHFIKFNKINLKSIILFKNKLPKKKK